MLMTYDRDEMCWWQFEITVTVFAFSSQIWIRHDLVRLLVWIVLPCETLPGGNTGESVLNRNKRIKYARSKTATKMLYCHQFLVISISPISKTPYQHKLFQDSIFFTKSLNFEPTNSTNMISSKLKLSPYVHKAGSTWT